MPEKRYQQAKRITLIGALVNTLLGIIKLIGGIFYQSHALLADGIHSFADLLTDLMVLVAAKFGSQDADDSHPYGHQRIETAATLLLSLFLILTGLGIIWDAADELYVTNISNIAFPALLIAIFSIITNELLFHYTRYIGNKINSALIIANAWHHRSDAAASIVVAIGLTGGLLGYSHFDSLAAIIVGFLIIKMGLSYGWNSVKELVDTAVTPEVSAKLEKSICEIDGVRKIHQLRSRLMGGEILVDVHILVNPFISVSEGHHIAQNVHYSLVKQNAQLREVTVHVDPEDDEEAELSLHLPSRHYLEKIYLLPLQQQFPEIKDWILHYLDGKIRLDLIVGSQAEPSLQLNEFLRSSINNYPIKEIHILQQKTIIRP